MHISLIGSGNTAAATLLQLAASDNDNDITLIGRNEDRLLAALLDTASAYPRFSKRIRIGSKADLRSSDVIAVCAGAQMGLGDTPKSLFRKNSEIANEFLSDGVSAKTRVVVIGTPVDDLAALFVASGKFEQEQVIGFGGDLDTARLHYVLGQDSSFDQAVAIGEHGSRTVPVYKDEANYAETIMKVRTLLKSITVKAGAPRNLATGVWLSRLILALGSDKPETHVVCGHMEVYDLCLTWPRVVSSAGLGPALPVSLGSQAQSELNALIEKKQQESKEIKVFSSTFVS